MKYQNNTSGGVVIPVKKPQIENEIADTEWIKFHVGDIKEVPEQAIAAAEANGLTKVDSIEETVEEKPKDEPKAKVKATESKVGKTKVETKKVEKEAD